MTTDDWRDSVNRRLTAIEASNLNVETRLGRVETKNAVDEVHRTNVERRLDSIEGTLKWLVRLILGCLITAAMAFIIAGGLGV